MKQLPVVTFQNNQRVGIVIDTKMDEHWKEPALLVANNWGTSWIRESSCDPYPIMSPEEYLVVFNNVYGTEWTFERPVLKGKAYFYVSFDPKDSESAVTNTIHQVAIVNDKEGNPYARFVQCPDLCDLVANMDGAWWEIESPKMHPQNLTMVEDV